MQLNSHITELAHVVPLSSRTVVTVPAQALNHARNVGLTLLRTFADQPSYVLGITSAVLGEGKTTLSLALAEVMATDFGLNVVLLDTHAERPWPKGATEEGDTPRGLSDWLCDECQFSDALVNLHEKCALLPYGLQRMTSRDLLQHLVRAEAIPMLRAQYSLILLDLPDLQNPAGAALANLCDGVVLTVRAGHTPTEAVREFIPALQNVMIHGVVLNRHRSAVPATIWKLFA